MVKHLKCVERRQIHRNACHKWNKTDLYFSEGANDATVEFKCLVAAGCLADIQLYCFDGWLLLALFLFLSSIVRPLCSSYRARSLLPSIFVCFHEDKLKNK